MDAPIENLFTEAMKLSPIEREDLAVRLFGSLEEPGVQLDSEWDAEIARRVEEIRSGKVELVPAEEVHRKMAERLSE